MGNFSLSARSVHGDNGKGKASLKIKGNTLTELTFVDVDDVFGAATAGEYVTLDGTTMLTYEFLGVGDLRGDPANTAAFIRVNNLDGTYTTFAVSMTVGGDPMALPKGNTKLTTGSLDATTPFSFPVPVCFCSETPIRVPGGEVLADDLIPGDIVETLDHGPQEILWIVRRTHLAFGPHAPVHFEAGAIGNPQPLRVSQQHRMLLTGWQAELLFGQPEVLVAAKHLVNGQSITLLEGGWITYIHLLFERHEIVFGAAVPSESYFPGFALESEDEGLNGILIKDQPQLLARLQDGQAARTTLRGHEARLLTAA